MISCLIHLSHLLVQPDGRIEQYIREPWQVRAYPILRHAWEAHPGRCCELTARAERWARRFGPAFNHRRHGGQA